MGKWFSKFTFNDVTFLVVFILSLLALVLQYTISRSEFPYGVCIFSCVAILLICYNVFQRRSARKESTRNDQLASHPWIVYALIFIMRYSLFAGVFFFRIDGGNDIVAASACWLVFIMCLLMLVCTFVDCKKFLQKVPTTEKVKVPTTETVSV